MKRKIGITILLIVSILIINVDGTYARTSKNLVKNPGFESSDFSIWKYKGTGMDKLDYYTEDPVGIWNKKDDCHSGNYTFHFWSTYKHHFKLEQTISKKKLNKNKTYKASVYIQGDEVGADAEIYLYVIADGKKYVSGMVELDGWQDWKKLTIDNIRCKKGNVKIGIYVDHAADGWGMIDDFYFGQE